MTQPSAEATITRATGSPATQSSATATSVMIYGIAFVTGAIVMSFEMLGSRYLNPYFGSGIYTWASLISTVLMALTLGYFLGGWLADRTASLTVLAVTVLVASLYMLVLPSFAQPLLELLLADIDDVRTGSLVASVAILLFPVTFFGMFSPFAIRLMLRSAQSSGMVSGTVYGVSTFGSIVGTLGTTFFLIPTIGTRAITLWLGAAGIVCGLILLALGRLERKAGTTAAALLLAFAVIAAPAPGSANDALIDDSVRAEILKRKDGRLAHIESEYNDIYISKRRNQLIMTFQLKGWDYTESVTNLEDPDDLPLHYSQVMTAASLLYPTEVKRILMIGLGGGSISTYYGRAMPDVHIDTVELDQRVIDVAKQYFALRETPRVRYIAADGRVFLNRSKDQYDLILLDAYRGGYVPFHLLTREFYTLVKSRLTPGGAVAFNVHDGTKLYHSTVRTLSEVFPTVDLYPSGMGEVIATLSADPKFDRSVLATRAAALQDRYKFRYALPEVLKRRIANPQGEAKGGSLITDDFAPVNLYDTIDAPKPKRKK
ncbi:MAG TPA: fused MFS/spermidine synthase [Xanthobacteraceae bacterium]|nr:fused MFS/spermidine synthase [Xanthobacteraceae bacterium]